MNLQLLRRPGPGFPAAVATSIDDVDAFLRDVDACLLGSAKVRSLHLQEVKDHILERRDHALDQGASESEATREALDMFGFGAEYGAEQRAGLSRRFLQTAASAGVLFGVLMFILDVIGRPAGSDALPSASRYIVQAVLYGLGMGWFVAFVWPLKVLPIGDRFARSFVVRRSTAWRVVFFAFAGVSALLGLASVVSMAMPGAVAYFGMSRLGMAALALLSAFNVRMMLSGAGTIAVDDDGIEIRMPWSRRSVPWSRIEGVERLGDRHPWIPAWNYWSRVRVVRYSMGGGAMGEAKIYPDVYNADRLMVLAREKLAGRGA